MTPMGNAIHEVAQSDSTRTMHIVTPPTTLPYMNHGFGMWEAAVMRAVEGGKDSARDPPMLFVIGHCPSTPR